MKKPLITLLLACVLAMTCVAAWAEPAFTVTPNPPEGINYSYKYNVVLFKGGETTAFMDKYIYDKLTMPAEDVGDDVYVALEDLKRIYAPDFTVTQTEDGVTVCHAGLTAVLYPDQAEATVDSNAYTFTHAPKTVDGVLMVPALELMGVAFGKQTQVVDNEKGNYFAVAYGYDELNTGLYARGLTLFDETLAGRKTRGFIYLTYTIEDDPDQKVLPVRLYVPTSYDPQTPMRTILVLHGRSVSQNYFWADTQSAIVQYRTLESFAEEYGYIIVTASAYLVDGNYGNVENYPYMVHDEWTQLDEETKRLRILSEKSPMTALELVKSLYNVDEEHLYLMGNSMGGMGTLYLGNKYAEMWDAIAPCGMMVNMELIGENIYPNLVDMPLLFVEGTEDQYGFDLAVKNFKLLAEYLNDTQFYAAPGGVHSTGWCIALPQIFDFFNAQE